MIIQSDNHPSIISLDKDLSSYTAVELVLSKNSGTILKKWTKDDMTFEQTSDGYTISVGWTQAETAALSVGAVSWELKALDPDGLVQFWSRLEDRVVMRINTEVLE